MRRGRLRGEWYDNSCAATSAATAPELLGGKEIARRGSREGAGNAGRRGIIARGRLLVTCYSWGLSFGNWVRAVEAAHHVRPRGAGMPPLPRTSQTGKSMPPNKRALPARRS